MHSTMKAWQLDRFGLANLAPAVRPLPDVGREDILVRVGAVSLNYRDLLVVEGQLLPEPPEMPFVPVSDFAGTVVAAGEAVSRVAVGDRVMGNFWTQWIDGPPPAEMKHHALSLGGPLQGALADYIAVPAGVAVKTPTVLSDAEAATLPIAGLTAWFALTEANPIASGDVVVVQGTGGVALAAAQFVRALGGRAIVLSRSEAKLDRVGAAAPRGVAPWATIDTSLHPDWPARVMELTAGTGAQHVVELIGGENVPRSLSALALEGKLSLIGFLGGMETTVSAVPFMLGRLTMTGVSVGHRRAFERMAAFIETHDVRPIIDRTYDFDRAREAFDHLKRGPVGKVVVSMERPEDVA